MAEAIEALQREGLSPRVRGNLILPFVAAVPDRSIPACAGEPLRTRAKFDDWGVYPRVCGGTEDHSPQQPFREGLSPRVRGNRTQPA